MPSKQLIAWPNAPYFRAHAPDVEWVEPPIVFEIMAVLNDILRAPSTELCIFPLPYNRMQHWARNGLLMPLDRVFSAKELNRYMPEALQLCTFNQTLYAIPEDVTPLSLMFRRSSLSLCAGRVPSTWVELEALLDAVAQEACKPLLLPRHKAPHVTISFLLQIFGASGVHPDGIVSAPFTFKQELMDAYAWLYRLTVEKEYIAERYLLGWESLNAFRQFLHAKTLSACYERVSMLKSCALKELSEFAVFPFPRRRPGVPLYVPVTGNAWCIPRNTADPETAVRVLRKLREPDFVYRCERQGGHPYPAWPELWKDKELTERHPLYAYALDLLRADGLFAFDVEPPAFLALYESLKQGFRQRQSASQWFAQWTTQLGSAPPPHSAHPKVNEALKYIHAQFAKVQGVSEVARKLRLNPQYFMRLFKQEVHTNCWDYVTQVRMAHACKLLQDSSLTVKEVAAQCGYACSSAFSKAFQKHFGLSPQAFRNQ